jgi:ParB family chromosome partitioning protein
MNTQTNANEELLKSQVEGFSNFDRELIPGGAVKTVMAGTKSRDLYQVKPNDLYVVEGFNPRTHSASYYAGIEALADNMVAHGYMQDKPISGYITKVDGVDRIAVNDGHRRLASVKRAIEKGAQIKTIPLVLKERSDNMVDLTLSLLHSNEGQPFNTYEKAVIAKRLKKYGWTNSQIATEMRCTTAFVGQMFDLVGSPEAIQELVKGGMLSATNAVSIVKEHGERATEVAKASVAAAAAKGKKRATAKDATDVVTPADQRAKNARKHGAELYKAVAKALKEEKVTKVMSEAVYNELDALMTLIEKVKKPKAPKEAKVPKAKAAKKVPLAKKVSGAAAKVSKIKTAEGPSGGAAFFDKLNAEQAAKKGENRAAANGRTAKRGRAEH